jgi:iron complex transport system ATP-binding protein
MLHLKNKPYTQISGGERQLVLIARTLAQEPEIILLDEPTSHLDFKNQAIILNIVAGLAQRGLTVVMSTHMPNQAFLFNGRVALMNDGKFKSVGYVDTAMTEDNLRDIYGINVKIVDVKEGMNGNRLRFCVPVINEAQTNTLESGNSRALS